ncbi:colicin [Citrobacter koseri]|uniref:Colicin n=1 Tax=Citrobacter koseri TaxID=545 RepID=A0A078LIQ3_CITKO|nr:colicin [Citrobacter koseri]CDZ86690.1 colicin [Citrobacter koseri]
MATKWDKANLPKELNLTIDGYKYRVTLNDNGTVKSIKQTAVRPYTKKENLQNVVAKANPDNPKYPPVDLSKGESQRQDNARKQAQAAWNNLPPNVRSFNVNVDEYHYSVTLDDYGSVTSVKRTAVRPLAKWEKGKAGIMEKIQHKTQKETYDTLKLNEGESQRQDKAKKAAQDVFNSFSMNRDRVQSDVLNKTAEIVSDMGEKVGVHLGEKYKAVAKEIANDIKNFQGKTLRTHEQTMASLNKILANPGMKINKGDKDALVNAWKSFKASDTAKKLENMSRAFKVADVALKVEKVREKSIHGYETGNWGPLMLEVESWVVGGLAARVALGLFSAILGSFLITLGTPVIAVDLAGIIIAASIAAWVSDDKVLDKLNNEVIRSAQ